VSEPQTGRQCAWMQGWEDGAKDLTPPSYIRLSPDKDAYLSGYNKGKAARVSAVKEAARFDTAALTPREKPSRRVQQSLFGDVPKAKASKSPLIAYREAFAAGARDALGHPFTCPSVKGADDPFVRAIDDWATKDGVKLGGSERLTWVREQARKWVAEVATPKNLEWPLQDFYKWLNTGGHLVEKKAPEAPKKLVGFAPPPSRLVSQPGNVPSFALPLTQGTNATRR